MTRSARTFSEAWRNSVALNPDHPFLYWDPGDEEPRSWSYAQFDALVADAASVLSRCGATPGARIHLVLANGPTFVLTWLAAIRLGSVLVPSDPRASASELASQVALTSPTVAIVSPEAAQRYRQAASLSQQRRAAVVLVCGEGDTTIGGAGDAVGFADVDDTSPAALLFTSGTTSAAKAVVVTQSNYARAGEVMATAADVTADSRWIVCLPLFHANAQYYSFAAAISRSASVALLPRFSATRFVEIARAVRATHASLFAAPIRMVLRKTPRETEPALLQHCWYAQNITSQEYARFSALISCKPRQLYGMTETMAAVLTNPALGAVPESMGRVTAGCHVKLQTVDGREPETGEPGEVCVGGTPGVDIFAGYWNDPEATSAAFKDGLLRTGDQAYRDGRGYYYFQGRHSDILKVAGENVSAVEVEIIIARHPAVEEVAVVGEADDVRDEVAVAFVVLGPGHDGATTVDELRMWCDQNLSPSKRPHRFYLVDGLPRTSVGKIRKTALRELQMGPMSTLQTGETG